EDHVRDLLGEHVLGVGRQLAAIASGLGIVGIGAHEVGELLAFAGGGDDILGLFFRGGRLFGSLAFGGEQDLAQEDLFFAHVFGLVLVVILFQISLGDVDAIADFLTDHSLGEHLAAEKVAVVFEGHPGLFAHEVVEFVGIGDLAFD